MNVLLIKAGMVQDCICADSEERAKRFYPEFQCVQQSGAEGPGWFYDGKLFTAPAPAYVVEDRRITQLAFLVRFHADESVAIDLASQGATVQAATLRNYTDKMNAAQWIDMARPDTRAGVQALEAAGLLAAGRALEILDRPITPDERPQDTPAVIN